MKLRKELNHVGIDDNTLASLVTSGQLLRIRRGAYRPPQQLDPEESHLELVRATVAQAREPVVVSHSSAAVVHGLPVNRRWLSEVHLLRTGPPGSERRGQLIRRRRRDVGCTVIDGIPVTPIDATVVDLIRWSSFRDGVAIADHALRRGLSRTDLEALVRSQPGRKGNPMARRVLAFANALSESAGESHGRARMSEAGVPIPELQREFVDATGVVRPDYTWEEQGVVGEFDGMQKYGRFLRPGQSTRDAVMAEKAREERLRRMGWWVIRFVWDDLATAEAVGAIVRKGFAMAAQSR